jgi:hypothetical protein
MEGKVTVTPQSPEELQRETLGTIARVCADIERCAMNQDVGGVMTQYDFLRTTMRRLDIIRTNLRRPQ